MSQARPLGDASGVSGTAHFIRGPITYGLYVISASHRTNQRHLIKKELRPQSFFISFGSSSFLTFCRQLASSWLFLVSTVATSWTGSPLIAYVTKLPWKIISSLILSIHGNRCQFQRNSYLSSDPRRINLLINESLRKYFLDLFMTCCSPPIALWCSKHWMEKVLFRK